MTGGMRLRFQKGDAVVIVMVALLALSIFLMFLPREAPLAAYAEIYQDGKLVRTVSLDRPDEFTLTGDYSNTITIRDGKIAITYSDCPGGDCVGCGWISRSGRSIVCLPNGVEIRVVAESGDVDFVVG